MSCVLPVAVTDALSAASIATTLQSARQLRPLSVAVINASVRALLIMVVINIIMTCRQK